MKHFRITYIIPVICVLLFSCAKEDEAPKPVDRTESFKNTVWGGDFQYAAGEYTDSQTFSILLGADGTLTWYDVASTRPGGTWKMNQDTIIITFPNTTVISATVTDKSWSDFKGGLKAGFFINQLNRAVKVEPSTVSNTSWKGTFGGSELEITILPGMKLNYSLAGSAPRSIPYTLEGAGIRFSYSELFSSATNYVVFTNETNLLRGTERRIGGLFPPTTVYYSYLASKL
ncbi:hypothetical protein [Dyadobacter sp. CY326]|uniref:hypothetical protein n=1 Tax=Dyadobacter sp. CY326 TaxID=2907300 RepID=UPI001F283C92|nr:hypothetical protein [Dyadobacter sp. CY326]MCE7065101.1 hypothetical protein [Dyadobacter sp. CY326]